MILTPTNFAVIRQFILREGDRRPYGDKDECPHLGLGFDVFFTSVADGVYDTMKIVDPRASGDISVRVADAKLHFKPKDEPFIEYYFAALISHISQTQ